MFFLVCCLFLRWAGSSDLSAHVVVTPGGLVVLHTLLLQLRPGLSSCGSVSSLRSIFCPDESSRAEQSQCSEWRRADSFRGIGCREPPPSLTFIVRRTFSASLPVRLSPALLRGDHVTAFESMVTSPLSRSAVFVGPVLPPEDLPQRIDRRTPDRRTSHYSRRRARRSANGLLRAGSHGLSRRC